MARAAVSNRAAVPNQNLILRSEEFDNAAWVLQAGVTVTADQTANPTDGAVTADLIDLTAAAADQGIYQFVAGNNGAQNTKSVWLKGVLGTEVVTLGDPAVAGVYTTCNLTTSWQRFSATDAAGIQTGSSGLWIRKSSGNQIYAWGAQVVKAAWEGHYVQTVGSAVNTGNIRNKPVVTQNLVLRSEQFDNAAWTISNVTVTPNTVAAPDGTNTADSIAATGASAGIYQGVTGAGKSNKITGSIWLRADEAISSGLFMNGSGLDATYTSAASITTAWQRFTVTGTCSMVSTTINFGVGVGIGGYSIPNGKTVYAWGAQLVYADWEGPYVQTVATAVNTGNLKNKPAVLQNLLTYSEQFDHANYSVTAGVVVTPDAVANPVDGAVTADSAAFAVTTSYRYQAISVVSGRTYTLSAWIWTDTKATIGMRISDGDGTGGTATSFALTTTATRVSVSFTMTKTGASCYAGLDNRVGSGGDGIAGNVYVFGLQVTESNNIGPYQQTVATVVNTANIRNQI